MRSGELLSDPPRSPATAGAPDQPAVEGRSKGQPSATLPTGPVVAIRGADARPRSFEVLDDIEQSGGEEQEVRAVLQRFLAGDDLAFADLYIRFFARVRRYLEIALKNPADAEDAAQHVFLKILEALPTALPLREPFRAWLFRVVRNHAIDIQRRSRRSEPHSPEALAAHGDTLSRYAPNLSRLGDTRAVEAMVARLPRSQQRAVVLKYVYEMTPTEIADVLSTTPAAIRQMLVRALRALGSELTTAG